MGKPLFSCGFANFAWIGVAYGDVLDDQGRIWRYAGDQPLSNEVAPGGLFLEAGLRNFFAGAVLQSRRVSKQLLAIMKRKAGIARHGKLENKTRSSDGGGAGCEAYVWEREAYWPVQLGESGDVDVRNTAPEAGELMAWLQKDLGMGSRQNPR